MSDFFREVTEEVRRDRAVEIWTRYQNLFIAIAAVIVLAAGGWRFYEWRRLEAAQAASSRFEDALALDVKGDKGAAATAFAGLAADAPDGYRVLARLADAAETAKTDPAAGVKAYDALGADPGIGAEFQQLAKLRAAILRMDMGDFDHARPALEELAAPTGAFRYTAREMLGVAALQAHDYDGAGRWLDLIVSDPDAPQGVRKASEIMLGLIASDRPAAK